MEIETPCNEPIRFNRARRKVYFYQYRFDRLNPLGKRNWGVKPVAYNWDDLTAEVYRVYRPMGAGGLIENILLSVRNPETDEVIDRVFFPVISNKGSSTGSLPSFSCRTVSKLFQRSCIAPLTGIQNTLPTRSNA
ncbi:DUF6708 domain-containing protein [Pseudomonas putida]|uniref:DUF6708 domain-containing protein n=1 Tax=Pseudomonas putida TaxID=303 RepID=UPI003AF16C17